MSNLISGKEAKLAWANNKEIEYMPLNKWNLLGGSTPLSIFDRDDVKFRLKPRAITINSVHHHYQCVIIDINTNGGCYVFRYRRI